MNYLDIFKIIPGSIVPSGRSYPENATARVALDVRKADGSVIPGCEISKGDSLTVIDVSYSRQLALVQYPTPGGIKQGYATAKYIDYKNQGNYHNGSTPEPVINYDGSSLGSLDPYETATKLFEVNGLTQVVYNTDKGANTKSGFVRYAGGSQNIVHVDIPYPNVTNAQMIQYGTSGKGRALRAYKMGNGRNSFIFNCAIHGWEDHWAADGIELTKIGNQLIEYFQSNSTGDFTLYVIPAANPDGLSEGWTNNGPGRCTIVGAVDGNRDFSVGFSAGGAPRNHSGSHPLSVPETKELADFISGIKANTSGETFLIDMHGWEGSMVGDSRIGRHFTGKLGLVQKGFGNPRGFLVQWTNSIGIVSSIMELPSSIYSHADVVRLNCAGKIIEGLTEIMGTTGGGATTGDYNGHIKSGIQYVNIRTVPTTSNNTPIGKLYGDNPIQILAKVKPYGDSYYWYKIVFIKNGERLQAYVREDFVTVTGEIPKDDIPSGSGEPSELLDFSVGQVNEKASSVHVRKGPSTATDIVTSVSSGELLNVIGKTQPGGQTIPWYEIKLNGQELYIRSDFVDIVPETKLDEEGNINSSTGWVHLRSLPGTGDECSIITKLNNGDWVEIFGELQPKGETIPWYRIRWQAGVGFVRSDFVSLTKIKVLEGLYNKAREFYPGQGIGVWNKKVFDYLRQKKYGDNGISGVIWNEIITPSKDFYNYVNKDTKLKENAEKYMYNELTNLYGSDIGMPHLAATTLGYLGTNYAIPSSFTGWAGDLATAMGQVIKKYYGNGKNLTINELEEFALELIGGNRDNSSFGLDNLYEDIDSIYFANNIGLYPIYELIPNYYRTLINQRKSIITNSILVKNKSLEESIKVDFNFDQINLIKFAFLNKLVETFAGNVFKNGAEREKTFDLITPIMCKALAIKIESINSKGILK